MKRILAIGIILLFIGMSISSSTGFNLDKQSIKPLNGKTLYVGGSGPNNYTKIQDAIDDASDGDTVFVYDNSSPYREDIVVGKSINLVGENRDTTVIEGKWGTVIEVSADSVNISGFTLRKGDSAGIWIVKSNNTNISGNTITSSATWGIYLESSSNNTISDNNINLNNNGITLYHSNNNIISGNNISNNKLGIGAAESNTNIISNNNISNNIVGIELGGKSHTISGNKITNNKIGIRLFTNYNNITKNNIENNDIIGLLLSTSDNNVIESNNFIGNKIQASFVLSKGNNWDENYWDNWIGFKINLSIFQKFPKVIVGILGINFDWHPAKEPHDI